MGLAIKPGWVENPHRWCSHYISTRTSLRKNDKHGWSMLIIVYPFQEPAWTNRLEMFWTEGLLHAEYSELQQDSERRCQRWTWAEPEGCDRTTIGDDSARCTPTCFCSLLCRWKFGCRLQCLTHPSLAYRWSHGSAPLAIDDRAKSGSSAAGRAGKNTQSWWKVAQHGGPAAKDERQRDAWQVQAKWRVQNCSRRQQ